MDAVPPVAEPRQGLFASLATKFGAIYFALWFTVSLSPLQIPVSALTDATVQAIARVVFHLATPVADVTTGSGDRLYDWLAMLAYLAMAVVGTAVWGLLDRRRRNDATIREILRVALRYGLGFMILGYGFAKSSQFPFPSNLEMAKPLGESTPMGLLWNFMGYSTPYAYFGGALEILGGFLLLFRRTTLLGATVFTAVMTNVFVLNLCYDVPVKLYSFHALLGGLILVAPDARRLVDVLVLNRPTTPRETGPPVRYRKLRIGVLVAKWAFVAWILWTNVAMALEGLNARRAPQSPLAGGWIAKDPSGPWSELSYMEGPMGGRVILRVKGQDEYRAMAKKEGTDALTLLGKDGKPRRWRYRLDGRGGLTIQEDGTKVELRRDDRVYPLARPHFHWIQERPRTP